MKNIEVALVLIESNDGFWLQRRSSDKKVGAAGLLGCFGGKIQKDETPEITAIRELEEEAGLVVKIGELKYRGVVRVVSDMNNESINVVAHHYVLTLESPKIAHRDKDGSHAEFVRINEIVSKLTEMTPATRAIFIGLK